MNPNDKEGFWESEAHQWTVLSATYYLVTLPVLGPNWLAGRQPAPMPAFVLSVLH